MNDQMYVVVAETGLSKNTYGADIRTSEPMPQERAQAFLTEVLAGDHQDFCPVPPHAQVLALQDGGQYLVVESRTWQPDRLSRLTIARQAAPGGTGEAT